MAHPIEHAKSSARRFGGKPEDYQAIHDFFDESKGQVADFRHRAIAGFLYSGTSWVSGNPLSSKSAQQLNSGLWSRAAKILHFRNTLTASASVRARSL